MTDSYGTNWGDVQLSIQGVDYLDGKLINAVVITAKDATGSAIRVPLFHLTNVWSANDMAWKAAQIHGLDGKDIVGITYYCSVKDDTVEAGNNDIPPYANYVYTYTVSGLSIPPVYQGTISAAFSSNSSIRLTGLPDDAVNVKAKVYHSEGRNNTTYLTPLAVDTADQDIDPKSVAVVNNSIPVSPSKVTVTNEKGDSMTYGEPVIDTEYTIELSCDNYILSKVSATYTGTTSGGGGSSSGSSGSSQSSAATEVSTGTAAENGQKVTNTTAAPTASVKDATASTKVSKAMADAIVREAKSHSSDTVVIAPKVSDAATVTRSEITLPDGLVKNLRSQTKADLRIETPAADVTIPYADLRELSSGALSVTTDKTAPDTVSVELAADGKKVENLSAPVLARLDLKDGQVAVLVNPDGTQTVLPKSIVEDGKTLVLLPGSATVQVKDTAKEFPDVKSEVWYADAVDFVSSHGLFLGVQEDTFAPGAEMNRAMLATVLWRLESERAAAFAGQFSDIPAGSWYTSAVAWAQESGIVQGYGDGTFGAEDSITREQLAVMLYRYAKTVGMSTNAAGSISSFSDAGQVSGWAEGALQWAVQTGIVTGTTDGRLNPSGTASRAEVAVMLQRLVREMLR